MSHCSQQIRDWFITNLTGITDLPNAVEGMVRQIASDTEACIVRSVSETITPRTVNPPRNDLRDHTIEVFLVARTYDAVDALSLAAEHAIEGAANFPGLALDHVDRTYDENVESDRGYVSITLSYLARYAVARDAVDTFI